MREKKFDRLDKQAFVDIVKFTKEHCERILHLANNSLVLEAVPPHCPDSVHPRKIAIEQSLQELEAARKETRRKQQ